MARGAIRRGDRMELLAGRTAVVTGGAQGLGYAIAEVFIAQGARVVLGDLPGWSAPRSRPRHSAGREWPSRRTAT